MPVATTVFESVPRRRSWNARDAANRTSSHFHPRLWGRSKLPSERELTDTREDIATGPDSGERDIVDFLVMRDQLGLHRTPGASRTRRLSDDLPGLDLPDRAGRVDARRADETRVHLVPVE